MIVLDASVLIAHLDPSDPHHVRARRLLLDTADEEVSTSVITMAEVLVGPVRAGRLAQAGSALSELEVTSLPVAGDMHGRLAALRAGTGLKLPDCAVLLAAEQVHAAIATFDDRLATVAHDHGHRVLVV